MDKILEELSKTIESRRTNKEEGSYTCYLFEKGLDKILKKCGEECSEMIIAAKNGDNTELKNEISDLIYHIFVLMSERGLPLKDVFDELKSRSKKAGNLKINKNSNKNS